MCARLLACPLCSQPGFHTLDALRNGLVSVATRPLACPVCNEILLGIDKLTIHLFGHTINANNSNITQNINQNNIQILHNLQTIPIQTWNILKTQNIPEIHEKTTSFEHNEQESSFILKDKEIIINSQITHDNSNNESKQQGQVIFLQNISDQIYSTNCEYSKIDENLTQQNNEQKKQIIESSENNQNLILTDSNLNSMQNNSLLENNVNIIENNLNCVNLTDSNLETSNLLQNNSNTIQNENLIQNSLQTNSNDQNNSFIQNNMNSIQNDTNFIQNSNQLEKNLQQSQENFLQDTTNLIVNNSSLIHQNEKIHNVETIENSWIQNNSSVITVKDTVENLDEIQEITIVNENKKNSYQIKSNENKLQNCEINEKTQNREKINDPILPYLKAFRLLASKEKTERCNICGYRCDDRKILILHKQLVHMIAEKDINVRPEDLLKNYPCHLCTKVFKMRGSLMVHMRVAHTNYNSGISNFLILQIFKNIFFLNYLINLFFFIFLFALVLFKYSFK